jgi:hypothetical protein
MRSRGASVYHVRQSSLDVRVTVEDGLGGLAPLKGPVGALGVIEPHHVADDALAVQPSGCDQIEHGPDVGVDVGRFRFQASKWGNSAVSSLGVPTEDTVAPPRAQSMAVWMAAIESCGWRPRA